MSKSIIESKFNIQFAVATISVIVLSLLASMQFFGISKDVEQYELFFYSLGSDYQGRFEPLFVYFSMIVRWLTDDFSFYIFSLTSLALSAKFFILSRFRFLYTNIVLYVLVLFSLHELTQYRASLAVALVYSSFYAIYTNREKFVIYLLFVSACFVHYSAAVFFPIVFLWKFYSKGGWVSILTFVLVSLIFFGTKYVAIQNAIDVNPTLDSADIDYINLYSSRSIILFVISVVGLLCWKSIDYNARPFWFVSIYGFVFLAVFSDIPVFANRLFEMTMFSYLIWIGFIDGFYRKISIVLLGILGVYLVYRGIYVDFLLV